MSSVLSEEPLTFYVNPNLLEDRLDPRYYKPEYANVLEPLEEMYEQKFKTLKEISYPIVSGATPRAKGEAYVEKSSGIPFIRSGDILKKMLSTITMYYIFEKKFMIAC